MKLDEVMWLAAMERLYDCGVPSDLLQMLEQKLRAKNWRGRDLYNKYYDTVVQVHSTFLEWYDSLPNEWEHSFGYDEDGDKCEDIWEMDSSYEALVINENELYVYNFDV